MREETRWCPDDDFPLAEGSIFSVFDEEALEPLLLFSILELHMSAHVL